MEQIQEPKRRPRIKNEDPFLTIQEAAEYCNVSAAFMYERVLRGDVDSQKLGSHLIRIRLSNLLIWLNQDVKPKRRRSRAV